jgi:hypothetical protein
MLGNYGAEGAAPGAGEETCDARWLALALMSTALGHLDSDSSIPTIIGARLQSAIDALWICYSNEKSLNLH